MNHRERANARRRWRRWIKRICEDAEALVWDDHIFRYSMHAIEPARRVTADNVVYQWLQNCYMTQAAIGIRRLIDRDERSYSLLLLLDELCKHNELLSRDSFVSAYHYETRRLPGSLEVANRDFDNIAGVNVETFPKDELRDDRDRLKNIRDRFWKMINKTIAHKDRGWRCAPGVPRTVSWQEIHDAVELIEQLCLKYHFLLLQNNPPSLLPANADDFDEDIAAMWS